MRDTDEIYDQIEKAINKINEGQTMTFMSYEEGVKTALEWALGDIDELPIAEDEK